MRGDLRAYAFGPNRQFALLLVTRIETRLTSASGVNQMNPKADIWMPLYVGDYLGGTIHLNTEQHGAYLLLLMACWKGDGKLLNDDAELANITKLTLARWRAHKPVLVRFFSLDGEWLAHKRVQHERTKALATSQARSRSGKEGAAARWHGDGRRMATAMANASQTDAPSPSPSPHSEPIGSGDGSPSIDAAEAIFSLGLPILLSASVPERSARSMLGFLRKTHGDEALLGAIQRCADEKAAQPVEFLQGCLKSAKVSGRNHTRLDRMNYREGVSEDGTIA